MKQTQIIMDMPITIDVLGNIQPLILNKVFSYFKFIDDTFSPFKKNSQISLINQGKISVNQAQPDVLEILNLARYYKQKTNGFFDIRNPFLKIDPSGIVKGWAIHKASQILQQFNCTDYYLDAGGDITASGRNHHGKPWSVGIKHPQVKDKIVKIVWLYQNAIATSGTYERGYHIYNPKTGLPVRDITSLTIIGPNILEADIYATAAFAMGADGIHFIESLPNFEGYVIDKNMIATYTSGFEKYTKRETKIRN